MVSSQSKLPWWSAVFCASLSLYLNHAKLNTDWTQESRGKQDCSCINHLWSFLFFSLFKTVPMMDMGVLICSNLAYSRYKMNNIWVLVLNFKGNVAVLMLVYFGIKEIRLSFVRTMCMNLMNLLNLL